MTRPIALVADDCRTLRLITARYLDSLGFDSIVVANAQDAFEEAMLRPFNLIITDLRLPDDDGGNLITRILSHCDLNRQTPYLFISAEEQDTLKQQNIPVDRLIKKPIDETNFAQHVQTAVFAHPNNSAH